MLIQEALGSMNFKLSQSWRYEPNITNLFCAGAGLRAGYFGDPLLMDSSLLVVGKTVYALQGELMIFINQILC
jgi:hypothetical protein